MKLSRALITLFLLLTCTIIVHADTAAEIQSKIDARTDSIKQLEAEIAKYQADIEALGKQANSLKNTLASLALSRKKLETDIKVTQDKIDSTNLQIKQLALDIDDKSSRIGDGKRVISQSLASIAQSDSDSLIEILLSSRSLADAWNNTEELSNLQAGVKGRVDDLQTIKVSLEDNKKKTEKKKAELSAFQRELSNQKQIIAETTKQQNSLLASTKNTESNYKAIVASKEAQKDAFEREVMQFESALQIAIDPSKIPHTGEGILSWPLDKIKITQYFGNTPFATKNPQIYNGKGHTGVDFAASIGTPVRAALGGTVSGVANTDIVRSCYSYGKWIMIKHANGLSTLYAHLSLQTVEAGEKVTEGQIIGYSGNTGYSTGPHLHFGVYATQGVRITLFTNSVNCKGATIPVADPHAYLNPLSYL